MSLTKYRISWVYILTILVVRGSLHLNSWRSGFRFKNQTDIQVVRSQLLDSVDRGIRSSYEICPHRQRSDTLLWCFYTVNPSSKIYFRSQGLDVINLTWIMCVASILTGVATVHIGGALIDNVRLIFG